MPYLTVDEIDRAIRDLPLEAPDLCTFEECEGAPTTLGRKIGFINVRHPSTPTQPRIPVLVIGGVHAREWAPPDALVSFVRTLVREAVDAAPNRGAKTVNYPRVQRTDVDPPVSYSSQVIPKSRVATIFDRIDLFIAPASNPDGRAFSMQSPIPQNIAWRKNRSPNPRESICFDSDDLDQSVGVDINRNFGTVWNAEEYYHPDSLKGVSFTTEACGITPETTRAVYRGDHAESEAETKMLLWLMKTRTKAQYFVDVHSAGPLILFSWGAARTQTTDKTQNFQNPYLHGKRVITGLGYGEYMPPQIHQHSSNLAGGMAGGIRRLSSADARARPNRRSRFDTNYKSIEAARWYPATGASTDAHLATQFATLMDAPYEARELPPERHAFTIECGSSLEGGFWPHYEHQFPKIEREVHLALWSLLGFIAAPSQGLPIKSAP